MNYILMMSVLLSAASCKKNEAPASFLPAQTYMNVGYGNDIAQRMDVYLPKARTTTGTKVIVMIHGGG
ncbi:MAG: alpha/beta hydrolase, partial [Chitinophagaceae bacterium]|nr:alpha/beta hydrolase [Chitinophagaceae bacterium]